MMWSDSTLNTLIILLLTVIFWLILTYVKRPKNLPPGPMGLPLLGYLPFLGKNPHITLTKLTKKYGDIIMIYIARERVVILSTFQLIKETLQKQGDIYIERPDSVKYIYNFTTETGMATSGGSQHVAIRRFVLSTMRNCGMGKSSMEGKILNELNCLIEEIKKLNGKPSTLNNLIAISVANVVFAFVFGRKYEYTDKKFQKLLQTSEDFVASIAFHQLYQLLPKFIHDLTHFKDSRDYAKLIYKEILYEVTELYKTYATSQNSDSFINAWKTEVENTNSTIAKTFYANENSTLKPEERIATIALELFTAGNDTTRTTLEWTILYLIKYPKIQEKLHQEIDNIIGKDRTPTMSDQKLMPYMEAIIMEVFRFSTIVPFAVPHCTTEDTTLNGYFIPKNTTIFPNIWAVHMNPELFPDPECFKPERFLTEDNQINRMEELIPFSIGKRQCPGESLARMEIFLYLASIFQHFTFTKEDDVDLSCKFAIVLEPNHQKIKANLR